MKKLALAVGVIMMAGVASAQAQQCRSNYNIQGEVYTTWQMVKGSTPAEVVPRLERALRNEDFAAIRVNRSANTVSGIQETSGSGRPQTIRLTARQQGTDTRVDLRFVVAPGQLSPAEPALKVFCGILQAAGR